MEHSSDEFAEAFLTKLDCRYIYRHRHRRKTFILPFPGLRTGGPEHPFANWHDQAAVFGNSYESIGRHETQVRMLPTKKSLQPDDLPRGNIHLRLIHQKKFFFWECPPHAALQRQSLHNLSIHLLREEPKVIASFVFGAVHSRIGVLDDRFGVRAV